ncbi:DUF397 domain-containing protein [Spirillospora sp. NPDC050679]
MDLTKAQWRKASRSSSQGDACVEVAAIPETVAIRDSKAPDGGSLFLNRKEARALFMLIKNI